MIFRFAIIPLVMSATAVVAAVSPQDAEFFEKKVRPVLADTCFKCHGADKQKGGLRLDSRAALLKGGDDGPVVVLGDPDKSVLIKSVRHEGEKKMPEKGDKLPAKDIEALTQWVKMGAPWPENSKLQAPAAKPHWAFQPVTKPVVPKSKSQNPIDAFVLAKLAQKKLAPSPPADKPTLIRRATFDLLGLPPTMEEVQAFVNDKSPDAFAKVVDRLLASPRFGERWGRYWLDIARYADTKGYVFEEERRYPYSYTYRDWVIRALNEDLPYDQFLIQQIAGDKLPANGDMGHLAAMGFLTVGRRFLNNQPDIIDDRLDVVCRGTMALTVGCARCHDHKFDPIPTRDYYALYSVFASSTEPKDLPMLGEPKRTEGYLSFAGELQKREAAVQEFKERRRKELLAELRKPEVIAAYLLAWRDTRGKNDDEIKTVVKVRDLNRYMFNRWKNTLESNGAAHAIFGPWQEFAALPDAEFAAKSPALAARIAANDDPKRTISSLVAALFAKPPASLHDVAERYGQLFGALTRAERKKYFDIVDEKGNVVTVFRDGDERANVDEEAVAQMLVANGAPLDVPIGEVENLFRRDDANKVRDLVKRVEEWKVTSPASPPRAMVLNDLPQPVSQRIFKRGNAGNLGDPVSRRFLSVLAGENAPEFKDGSGRLELARAIADKNNPLTARVAVNRIWMHLFGVGLVRTPSDFGTRSEPPSHPELLDWLASRFMDDGWSVKKLIRGIVLSSTYQQSCDDVPKYKLADAEDTLLWKQRRRRLDFEAMRDALLAVSGKLDLAMGGPSVDLEKEPFTSRRSVYGYIERQNLPAMFRTFDFASPDAHASQRFVTTVPQQALFMMNSPFVVEQARKIAECGVRSTDSERIRNMYRQTYARDPTGDETKLALQFIRAGQTATDDPRSAATWQYGYGYFDPASKRVNFTALPHWTGRAWQGGPSLPDAALGWVTIHPTGGHPGNDLQHAAIRRWVAPKDCAVTIAGSLKHPDPNGDGVRGYIVSSRAGILAQQTVAPTKTVAMNVDRVEVKQGDTIDFIVDINANLNCDMFEWSPEIRESGATTVWSAARDFAGPGAVPPRLTAWEKLAQVLLAANEFVFVD